MSTNQNSIKFAEIPDPSITRHLFSPSESKFSNRHCFTTDRRETIVKMPLAPTLKPARVRSLPSCRSDSVFEDAFYWLAAAPVLAYLGFLVFSL
jgi:hypothetical protein